MKFFRIIFFQTLIQAFRRGGGAFGALAFYVIVATLFTFALGPEIAARNTGPVMSVAMLLSIVTSLPLFFERDYEDGMLEQYLLQPVALELITLAKITGQWLAIIGPILMVSPLIAVANGLAFDNWCEQLCCLALASVSLVCVGAIAGSLTLGHKRGGLLQALILLPLSIPILIFASSSSAQTLYFLFSILLALIPISCFLTTILIRISQD